MQDRMAALGDGNRNMKKAMAGAKVLTPLVASVCFAVPSDRPAAERKATLRTSLMATLQVTDTVAATHEQLTGHPVPQWVRTQLMTSAAEQIGRKIERQRSALVESQVEAFAQGLALIPAECASTLADVVATAGDDSYHVVASADDARARIAVTLIHCSWRMYDWVTHERLSLDPRLEHPSRFFSYGVQVEQIVQEMLRAAVDQACAFVTTVDDPDMRVAHLQNAINRFTHLLGSEYVTRTRAIMNWIGQGQGPAECTARSRQACERFPTETLPRLLEHARSIFAFIESGAAEMADGLYHNLLSHPNNAQSEKP